MLTIIADMLSAANSEGYFGDAAEAKICQDLILKAIAESSLSRHATIKGGVVMRALSHSSRRATLDLDVDFIRYSIENDSIDDFISKLNCLPGIHFERTGPIEELKQQDYRGRRIHLSVSDSTGAIIQSKVDLGVHKDLEIEQVEYCFEVDCFDGKATLLINSKEQMIAEKLKSLLKFGARSTRFKDVFDIYYLLSNCDQEKLKQCIERCIFADKMMRENDHSSLRKRLRATFSDEQYLSRLKRSEKNWVDLPIDEVLSCIVDRFSD